MMKKTLAITATDDTLIVHEFESEEQALREMPFIKKWERSMWDTRYTARYHGKNAIRYWDERRHTRICSTRIIHELDGSKKHIYE